MPLAHIEVPASLLNAPSNTNPTVSASTSTAPAPTLAQEKKRKHHLSASTDPIFAELRDLNFASVGKRLNKAARRLDEDYRVRIYIYLFGEVPLNYCSGASPSICVSTA